SDPAECWARRPWSRQDRFPDSLEREAPLLWRYPLLPTALIPVRARETGIQRVWRVGTARLCSKERKDLWSRPGLSPGRNIQDEEHQYIYRPKSALPLAEPSRSAEDNRFPQRLRV